MSGGQYGPSSTISLVFVVLLVAWMGDANGGYVASVWVLPACVFAALALLVSASGLFKDKNFGWGALALGLFAAYAAWTTVSVLWSPNKGDAWLGVGQTLLYLLAFLVSVSFIAMGASRRWVLAASTLGPAVITVLTLHTLVPRFEAMFDDDRLVGTLGYYNSEAAFLLVPLNPEHYAPYASLAKSYQNGGQPEKALEYYRKALSLNPLDHERR